MGCLADVVVNFLIPQLSGEFNSYSVFVLDIFVIVLIIDLFNQSLCNGLDLGRLGAALAQQEAHNLLQLLLLTQVFLAFVLRVLQLYLGQTQQPLVVNELLMTFLLDLVVPEFRSETLLWRVRL